MLTITLSHPLMAPDLSALYILLITSTLSGIPALSTVTDVSVKTGQTITIPCLYDQGYSSYVKYWCHGYTFNHCSSVARTDNPKTTGKTLISDDVKQNIFTVTMTNLQIRDSGHYWCAIEKGGPDVQWYVSISVTQGSDRLYVDQQKVTAVEGLDATIRCYYGNAGSMKWCQLGGSCVNGGSGSLDGVSVELMMRTNGNVLVVTLRGLKRRHTGWYWCAVEDLQMPVHITVNEETIVGSFVLKALLIPLGLLMLLISGGLVAWRMLVRRKEVADPVLSSPVRRQCEKDPEVLYSTVTAVQRTQVNMQDQAADNSVTYTTDVHKDRAQNKDQSPDNSVIYSSVGHNSGAQDK